MSRKNSIIFFIFIYLVTIAVLLKSAAPAVSGSAGLTAMLIESSLPCMEVVEASDAGAEAGSSAVTAEDTGESGEKTEAVKKNNGKPRVLIYHTHATESYLPASAGNYHTTAEENTVRDAGDVLEATLEENGIAVIHDKTLHDNPSYNNSYSRSYETVTALLKKYPTIECIIDLHRDATAAEVAGQVEKVNGKTCSVYSYVLSNTTNTYSANKAFLDRLNGIAAADYGGYTGNILERPYWYNQELCEKSVLIEMGNNRNNIKDVRRCAEVFGEILSKALNE
mgnify:CR=1 FL=1